LLVILILVAGQSYETAQYAEMYKACVVQHAPIECER